MTVGRMLTEDIEAGTLRLKLNRALNDMHDAEPDRRGELHVSDFVDSDKSWCPRRLIVQFFAGQKRHKASWVMYDGKERETKWKKVLERAGALVAYQPEYRVGDCVGHPDFVVVVQQGKRRILDLTGHDSKVSPAMIAIRRARKVRQVLIYMSMSDVQTEREKGFILDENKGSNEFKIITIRYDATEADRLMLRVKTVTRAIKRIREMPEGSRWEVLGGLPSCQRKKCDICRMVERRLDR